MGESFCISYEQNWNFLVLKSLVSGLIGISSCSMKLSMSQILLSIYGVFAVCWVNAIGRLLRNLVSALTLRISVRRETMQGSYVLGYWKEVVAGPGRMPKLFRWLMSPGELWAGCVFSEWDWDLFWGKIPLVMRDFGMLLWFEWVLQVLLLETSSALQWYWKVRPFRD